MSDGPALAARLSSDLSRLRDSVADAESAFGRKELLGSTRDDVVELSLIRAMGLFEEFIGDLFVLAMESRLGVEIVPIVPARSREEAVLLIAGADASEESRYVSWMPFRERTLPRARRLLTNAQPFGRIAYRSAERTALHELVLVRNRIAHDSPSARAKFEELSRAKGYPSSRAADYLTSARDNDSEIRLALVKLESIAKGLAEPTEMGSRAVLDAEDPFAPAGLAPPGTYECQRGAHSKTIAAFEALGECRSCPTPTRCPTCSRLEKTETSWVRVA